MIIAVAGGKGAPGATALAALLAGVWSTACQADGAAPAVIVEADPDGGVLAARWHGALGVTHDPGLLSLAADRDGSALDRLHRHAQEVDAGTALVAGPPGAPQAEACLHALGSGAPTALRDAPVTCVVDCGRLHPGSPARPWAEAAQHLLVVTRPRLDEVVSLQPSVERLRGLGLRPELVCFGDRPFPPDEVAGHAGVPLAGALGDDPAALAALFTQGLRARRLTRSRLHRSVVALARRLATVDEDCDGTSDGTSDDVVAAAPAEAAAR